MLLTRQGLRIRDAAAGDAALLCRWWNDGRVMAHAGFPNGLGTTPEAVEQQLLAGSDGAGRCLILEADGQPIGEMCYRNKRDGVAEIGIKICEASMQGRGYGPVFLNMLLSGLFFELGYEKVILDTNLNNLRAQHVYEKLGFRRLRVNRDAWLDQLGRPQSAVDYEMTRAEFAAMER